MFKHNLIKCLVNECVALSNNVDYLMDQLVKIAYHNSHLVRNKSLQWRKSSNLKPLNYEESKLN